MLRSRISSSTMMRLLSIFSLSPVHCLSMSSFDWPLAAISFSSCSGLVWNCLAIMSQRALISVSSMLWGRSKGFFSISWVSKSLFFISRTRRSAALFMLISKSFLRSSKVLNFSLTSCAKSSSRAGRFLIFTALRVARPFLSFFPTSFVSPFFIPTTSSEMP